MIESPHNGVNPPGTPQPLPCRRFMRLGLILPAQGMPHLHGGVRRVPRATSAASLPQAHSYAQISMTIRYQ